MASIYFDSHWIYAGHARSQCPTPSPCRKMAGSLARALWPRGLAGAREYHSSRQRSACASLV